MEDVVLKVENRNIPVVTENHKNLIVHSIGDDFAVKIGTTYLIFHIQEDGVIIPIEHKR